MEDVVQDIVGVRVIHYPSQAIAVVRARAGGVVAAYERTQVDGKIGVDGGDGDVQVVAPLVGYRVNNGFIAAVGPQLDAGKSGPVGVTGLCEITLRLGRVERMAHRPVLIALDARRDDAGRSLPPGCVEDVAQDGRAVNRRGQRLAHSDDVRWRQEGVHPQVVDAGARCAVQVGAQQRVGKDAG